MPLFSFEGVHPTVHPSAWIAPTATLVGNVTVEANASVWYGAVLPGTQVAGEVVLMGAAARKPVPLSAGARFWVDNNAPVYQELARRHRDGIESVERRSPSV